jgi:hypothetical protein
VNICDILLQFVVVLIVTLQSLAIIRYLMLHVNEFCSKLVAKATNRYVQLPKKQTQIQLKTMNTQYIRNTTNQHGVVASGAPAI